MWGFLKFVGRGIWWVLKQGYLLPGVVGIFIIKAARDLQKALRDRAERGTAAYPLLNRIMLVALGLALPLFEAGWTARAARELVGLMNNIVAGVAARQKLAGLGPRVRAKLLTPWLDVVGVWLSDWLFTPGWIPL